MINEKRIQVSVIILIVIIIVIISANFLKSLIKKLKENNFDNNDGEKINQWITRIRAALEGWGFDNEDEVYSVMREIKTQMMFNKVSREFKKKYNITLGDYLKDELDTKELNKAYSYLL